MRKLLLVGAAIAALAINITGQQLSLDAMIDRDIAAWLTTYRNLHTASFSFGVHYGSGNREYLFQIF